MAFKTFLLSGFSFGGSNVENKSTATIEETSQVNQHTSDSSRAVNLVTVDRKGASISIETFDNSAIDGAGFRVGRCGTLIMKGKQRGCGEGLETTELTITLDDAVLVNSTNTMNSEGESMVVINFEAYDPDSDDSTAPDLITYS